MDGQTTDALPDPESKFKVIFEKATAGILLIGGDGICVEANPAACELLGVSQKEIRTRKITELIKPVGAKSPQASWPSDFHLAEKRFESQALRADGKELRLECGIEDRAFLDRFLVFIYDITARVQTESAFLKQAEILDLANDTIMIRNLNDRIVYWNQGAERLYGWTKQEALGQYVHTFLQTSFPHALNAVFDEFLQTGHWDGQLEHSKKDGTRITVASRWTLQRDEHGQPAAYLEINNDITELKRAEVELKKAHDLLEKRVADRTAELLETNTRLLEQIAERKKTEQALKSLSARLMSAQEEERRRISRDLHDDLGQVLTSISLDLERAIRIEDLAKRNDLVKRVLDANREARNKLRELSSLLRPPVLDDVGLKEAIHTHVTEFSSRTGINANLAFHFNNEDIPGEATTNVYRILQEALTNISRYARAKNVHIDLQSSHYQVTLMIKDDGIGFDPDSTRTDKSLGLAGMKERAELLGGYFRLTSKPGSGTEILVSFPIEIHSGKENPGEE